VSFVFLPIVLIWIMLLAIEKRVPVRYRSDVESIGKGDVESKRLKKTKRISREV
jgi:hypothetical protein